MLHKLDIVAVFYLDYIGRITYIRNMNTIEPNEKNNKAERIHGRIDNALRGLKFGSVLLTVHDSRIVQIERIEKSRFDDLYLEDGEGI
jgi:hypothetical protein